MRLDAFSSLGRQFRGDVLSGKSLGVLPNGDVIDPECQQRNYSINYHYPAAERSKLTLLTEPYVNDVTAPAVKVTINVKTETIMDDMGTIDAGDTI